MPRSREREQTTGSGRDLAGHASRSASAVLLVGPDRQPARDRAARRRDRARCRCRSGYATTDARVNWTSRAVASVPRPEPGRRERFPRSRMLERATLGLGGVDRTRPSTLPAAGLAILPSIPRPAESRRRPRPDRRLSGRRVRRRNIPLRSAGWARSRGAPRTSATTVCSAHAAELHDHVEPLHARRLPDSAQRAALPGSSASSRARTAARSGSSRPNRPASAAPATAASSTPKATAPPVPRRARSTATSSRSATAGCCSAALQRQPFSPRLCSRLSSWLSEVGSSTSFDPKQVMAFEGFLALVSTE